MSDPINFQSYRKAKPPPQLTPDEKQFDAIVFTIGDMPLPVLISALFAARDAPDLAAIVAVLAEYIAYYTNNKPDAAS